MANTMHLFVFICHADNAQLASLKAEIAKARAAALGPGEEEDAFAGFDTPKDPNGRQPKKLCMVCMDNERGECQPCKRKDPVLRWLPFAFACSRGQACAQQPPISGPRLI